MGKIVVSIQGSFGSPREKVFSTIKRGHADAVARAIEWLSSDILPKATVRDHELHSEGDAPTDGWQR